MKQRKNLEQIKNMISKNKKIVIAIILIIILSLVIGIAFASKPSDNKKTESQTEQKIDVSEENNNKEEEDKKEENENSKTDKNTDNSNTTSTTKDNNNSSTDSNKKDTSSSNAGNSGGSDKPSQPAHQHSWKQHTAQKWVSNMVTVPDYETQKVAVGTRYIFAYDGYTTTSEADAKAHSKELILAGLPDNRRLETIYDEKQVQVGSHQEDHGHHETYVDYEYCDCGARR